MYNTQEPISIDIATNFTQYPKSSYNYLISNTKAKPMSTIPLSAISRVRESLEGRKRKEGRGRGRKAGRTLHRRV